MAATEFRRLDRLLCALAVGRSERRRAAALLVERRQLEATPDCSDALRTRRSGGRRLDEQSQSDSRFTRLDATRSRHQF